MAQSRHIPDLPSAEDPIRKTAVLAMVGTLVFTCVMSTYIELSTRSALLAMSNLPMTVLLPFVFWLLGNAVLKRFCPRLSLSSSEMRVLFCLVWIGGLFAGFNWATQWAGMMAAPRYFASPENRWEELYFDDLPDWMLPLDSPGVVDGFYQGVWAGVPWGAWLAPLFWAGSIALAIAAVGLGLTALFQKQWAHHERLVYPLAEVSLELTEGFDRKRGWPPFVKNRVFWVGFVVAAVPLLWNIGAYFIPDFPRIAIFDPMFGPRGRRGVQLSRYLPPFAFSYRILPTLSGFTFLCDLNILFSIWSVFFAGLVAQYGMNRVGFTIGLEGQTADGGGILSLFSNGAMAGLAAWGVWTARGHLKRVWEQVRKPRAWDVAETAILSPRGTVFALAGGLLYMAFWLYQSGNGTVTLILWMAAFWIGLFVSMKLLAAIGFAYLFPFWAGGTPMLGDMFVGTRNMSTATLVSTHMVNHRLLAGWRVPTALPNIDRVMARSPKTNRLIWIGLLLGVLIAGLYTIWLCYTWGGASFHSWALEGSARERYNIIAGAVANTDRTVPDLEKISAYLIGVLGALVFAVLQARIPWWPIHPIGLMVMYSWHLRIYVFNIFLVWLAKLLILKFGGILLYRRVRPCCYGLIVGFVFAIGMAFLVDVIWFPDQGHGVHGW